MGVADVRRAAAFWMQALGYVPRAELADDWVVLRPADGNGPQISLGLSETPLQEHPRVHLDLYAGDAADQAAEIFHAHFAEFTRLGDSPKHQTLLAGDHVDFASELAGTVCDDGPFSPEAGLDNFHAPGKEGEEVDVDVAGTEQDFARLDSPYFTARANAFQLGGRQDRKHLGVRIKRTEHRPSGHACSPVWNRQTQLR